ncbi:MAG: hypothetical protein KatS3mg043_2133 [Rhodothermaceae bacterium]|uniref:hypothetical protein n=1 Tax=Rhodocaloribacter litoris TaxID=2558931 RepID=UPI001E553D0F|nr:hypothetical protein [Rhodocaloribacter litoris]GIV61044.1 MAG: hypothetical protein KatS3mg043_2133 [Rhodothermaceae bacterium]
MNRLLKNLFDFERPETTGERLFYRLFELAVLYWVLHFAWDWGFYIQRIGEVVLPLGIAQYIDISFMFEHGVSLLNAGAITVAAALAFFRRWRYGYLAALLLLHLQYVSRFCLGEISHGSNIIGMVLVGMALAPLCFDDRDRQRRFVFGFSYFFLGLGYVSAAVCKLVASGPGWVDGRHLWMWIAERTVDTFSITGEIHYTWVQELALSAVPIATLILTFGLLAEFFAFLMWFKRTRPYIMTLLLTMHIGILLSMQINFPANNVMLLLLAYPWHAWIDRGLAHLGATAFERIRRASLRFT